MLERICPECGAANASDQRCCSDCGEPIEQPLARRSPAALNLRTIRLPAQWQQTGRVVALGLLTVAAEAGIHWLQRRQQASPPSLPSPASLRSQQRIVALQQRIIEQWQGGQLQQRTIERTVWFSPEQTER